MPITAHKASRLLVRAAALAMLCGAGTAVTAFAAPAVAAAGVESPAARDAVVALLEDSPAAAARLVPADFAAVMGYLPVDEGPLLANPDGGCSSPVPLPSSFDAPCRAHDLGYDLLRYAQLAGGELGPWARQGIDAQFAGRLRALCGGNTGCGTMANTAVTAVDMNSWRQHYAVPVREPVALYVLGGAGLAATALVPGLLGSLRGRVAR